MQAQIGTEGDKRKMPEELVTSEAKPDMQIQMPDVSSLPVVDFDAALKLRVTDDASAAVAREMSVTAKDFISSATALFEKPTKMAHALHTWFTGTRARTIEKAIQADEHCKAELKRWIDGRKEEAAKLQAEKQREENARALAVAEEERRKKIENAMPWEIAEIEAAPVQVVARTVIVAAEPVPEGIGERKKPWSYVVDSMPALLKAILENPELSEAIQINDKYMKMKAKDLKSDLGKRFPGIRGVRDTAVSTR